MITYQSGAKYIIMRLDIPVFFDLTNVGYNYGSTTYNGIFIASGGLPFEDLTTPGGQANYIGGVDASLFAIYGINFTTTIDTDYINYIKFFTISNTPITPPVSSTVFTIYDILGNSFNYATNIL